MLMILELVPLGSMLEFLTDHPESVRVDMELPLWVRSHFPINCALFLLLYNHMQDTGFSLLCDLIQPWGLGWFTKASLSHSVDHLHV